MTLESSDQTSPTIWLSRYQDVRSAFGEEQLSTAGHAIECGQNRPLLPLQAEGPKHRRIRRQLEKCVGPASSIQLDQIVSSSVERVLGDLARGVEVEVHGAYSRPLVSAVMSELLGLSGSEPETMMALHDQVMAPHRLTGSEPAPLDIGIRIDDFLRPIVARSVRPNVSPLLQELRRPSILGQSLSEVELVDVCYLLLIAALDTVARGLTTTISLMASAQRDMIGRFVEDGSIAAVVEEILRLGSPARAVSRIAQSDFRIDDEQIRTGDRVVCLLRDANHDEAVYSVPSHFDPERVGPPHLAFGRGRHRCIGAHLARLQLTSTILAIHREELTIRVEPATQEVADPSEWLVATVRRRS